MLLTTDEIGGIVEGIGTTGEDLRNEELIWSGIAKAQLKKVVEEIPTKFRREVIPSGSKVYSDEVVELLQRLNVSYFMIPKEDWQSLIDEVKE